MQQIEQQGKKGKQPVGEQPISQAVAKIAADNKEQVGKDSCGRWSWPGNGRAAGDFIYRCDAFTVIPVVATVLPRKRESRKLRPYDPPSSAINLWIPACAGMTVAGQRE